MCLSISQSVCSWEVRHVTITHDALELTIQAPCLQPWPILDTGPQDPPPTLLF